MVRPEQVQGRGGIKAGLFPAGRRGDQKVDQSLEGMPDRLRDLSQRLKTRPGSNPAQVQVQAEGKEGVGQQGFGHFAGFQPG